MSFKKHLLKYFLPQTLSSLLIFTSVTQYQHSALWIIGTLVGVIVLSGNNYVEGMDKEEEILKETWGIK